MTDRIENPWSNLTEYEGKYFAECDREALERFSRLKPAKSRIVDLEGNGQELNEDIKLHLELIPEPFIGNPATAAFVFLSINPGFSEEDEVAFKLYRDVVRENFETENSRTMYWVDTDPTITPQGANRTYVNAPRKYYFGNPKDLKSEAGSGGRLQLLLFMLSYKGSFEKLHTELQNERGMDPQDENYLKAVKDEVWKNRCPDQAREIVRNHVAVVDLFPYHSKKIGGLQDWMFSSEANEEQEKTGLGSRFFTKQMVEDALDTDARILVSRGCDNWFSLVPALIEHVESEKVFMLNSVENNTFTPNNVRKMLREDADTSSKRKWKKGNNDKALFWDTVDHIFEAWNKSAMDSR